MTAEDQAVQCRNGLQSTLRSVHEWTATPHSASSQLLHHMNGVLRAAVDTNFGDGCPEAIKALFLEIDGLQSGMVSRCEEMPLFFFARSFAVVLEEAVRQLQQPKNNQLYQPKTNQITVPPVDEPETADRTWSCDTPTEDDLVMAIDDETKVHEDTMDEEEEMKGTESVVSNGLGECPAREKVAADERTTASTARSVSLFRRVKKSPKKRDFSANAIEGRLYIFNIAPSTLSSNIELLLRPFGTIIEFCRPYKGSHFCFAKMESNAAADAAVAAVDGTLMGGIRLRVRRAAFTTKEKKSEMEERGEKDECSLPPPRFGCYKGPPAASEGAAQVSRDSDDDSDISSLHDFSVD